MMLTTLRPTMICSALAAACAAVAGCAKLEAPPVAGAPPKAASAPAGGSTAKGGVADLAWLAGCWQNSVNERDLREEWLPLRGGMLVGAAEQTMQGAMQDYEFLRIESRGGAVEFTQFGTGGRQATFRLASTTTDGNDTIFTFEHMTPSFPEHLIYRRGEQGWLYETIEGTIGGAAKRVVYPLRRVDCESGDLIAK